MDVADRKTHLANLASQVNELRLLPVPYGLLAHELVEVIDNERIMPGITWISKMAEDFPQVDCHSMNKETDKSFVNLHQFAFL